MSTPLPAPSPSTTRTARKPRCRSPAAGSSCNGSRISERAGPRSASTSRCSARITDRTWASMTASARRSAGASRDWKTGLGSPVGHMQAATPPQIDLPVPFALLLNLVSASNAHDKSVLWGFISRHVAGVTPQSHPELDRLAGYAIRYFDDFVKPAKVYRSPDPVEREALLALSDALGQLPGDADGQAVQNISLNVARKIERYQDHNKKSPEG